jgi:hypothetical protein
MRNTHKSKENKNPNQQNPRSNEFSFIPKTSMNLRETLRSKVTGQSVNQNNISRGSVKFNPNPVNILDAKDMSFENQRNDWIA